MLQTKHLPLNNVGVKYNAEIPGRFSGYASVFGGVDSYGDTIVKGAYEKTLKNRTRPIQLKWQHAEVIGKWFELKEDEVGLFGDGDLAVSRDDFRGHSRADDVYALMKTEAVTGLSIGYYVKDATDMTLQDGSKVRMLKEIELIEVSIVEMPADVNALITNVKSENSEEVKYILEQIESCKELKDIERLLRDAAGFTRADATALVSGIRSIARRDCEAEIKAQSAVADYIKTITSKII